MAFKLKHLLIIQPVTIVLCLSVHASASETAAFGGSDETNSEAAYTGATNVDAKISQLPDPSESTKRGHHTAQPADPSQCEVTGIPSYDTAIQQMLQQIEGGEYDKPGKIDAYSTTYGLGNAGDEGKEPNCDGKNLYDLEQKNQSAALKCAEYCFNKYYLKPFPSRLQAMQDILVHGGPQDVIAFSQLIIFKPAIATEALKESGDSLKTPSSVHDFIGYIMEKERNFIRWNEPGDYGRYQSTESILSCYDSEQGCSFKAGNKNTTAEDIVSTLRGAQGQPADSTVFTVNDGSVLSSNVANIKGNTSNFIDPIVITNSASPTYSRGLDSVNAAQSSLTNMQTLQLAQNPATNSSLPADSFSNSMTSLGTSLSHFATSFSTYPAGPATNSYFSYTPTLQTSAALTNPLSQTNITTGPASAPNYFGTTTSNQLPSLNTSSFESSLPQSTPATTFTTRSSRARSPVINSRGPASVYEATVVRTVSMSSSNSFAYQSSKHPVARTYTITRTVIKNNRAMEVGD
jgi:hypothetical protein